MAAISSILPSTSKKRCVWAAAGDCLGGGRTGDAVAVGGVPGTGAAPSPGASRPPEEVAPPVPKRPVRTPPQRGESFQSANPSQSSRNARAGNRPTPQLHSPRPNWSLCGVIQRPIRTSSSIRPPPTTGLRAKPPITGVTRTDCHCCCPRLTCPTAGSTGMWCSGTSQRQSMQTSPPTVKPIERHVSGSPATVNHSTLASFVVTEPSWHLAASTDRPNSVIRLPRTKPGAPRDRRQSQAAAD